MSERTLTHLQEVVGHLHHDLGQRKWHHAVPHPSHAAVRASNATSLELACACEHTGLADSVHACER